MTHLDNMRMKLSDFYKEHFSNLCCYEDYLMRIDLMGKKHNDEEILNSLRKCDGHKYIVANGKVVWIDDNGEKEDNPIGTVDKYAFLGCNELESVVIPEGVTCIEDYAFNRCCGLTSVKIPSSVTSIGNYAFDCCRNLKSVRVPKKCEIGLHAFSPTCNIIRY